jgi:hypothetical protein
MNSKSMKGSKIPATVSNAAESKNIDLGITVTRVMYTNCQRQPAEAPLFSLMQTYCFQYKKGWSFLRSLHPKLQILKTDINT